MRPTLKKLILIFVQILLFVYFLNPGRNASNFYYYIRQKDIEEKLLESHEINRKVNQELPYCMYKDILNDGYEITIEEQDEKIDDRVKIMNGGEFFPPNCIPKYSSAVIVPYRSRETQLHKFLMHMHRFLSKQLIHYKIFVVEQIDDKPFNRASLFNIGAVHAIEENFPCLIFHDVDLLPLKSNNIYACTQQPRHLSSNINTFRYNLPYTKIFGGAVAISSKQFKEVNGMSNMYFGWGAEDDDFYDRISSIGLEVWRFEPAVSLYYMVYHKPADKGYKYENKALLENDVERMASDGLNSLKYEEEPVILHPLFTHIIVRFPQHV